MAKTTLFDHGENKALESLSEAANPFVLVDSPHQWVPVRGSFCVFCNEPFATGDACVLIDGELYHEDCHEESGEGRRVSETKESDRI